MKRTIFILSVLLSSYSLFAIDFALDGIKYTTIGTSAVAVIKGGNYNGNITIPSFVTYSEKIYSVTAIQEEAFYNCSGLTGISIPSSVISIESSAFDNCSGLTSIFIPNSITSISKHVFSGCSGLSVIEIPNSVNSIKEEAFEGCTGIKSFNIPGSVTLVEVGAFSFCPGLINVDPDNPNYASQDGIFYNKDKTTLIQCPISKFGSIEIPASVKTISEGAFASCKGLTCITIPNSVTIIAESAFEDCQGLVDITIPCSVTSIKGSSFQKCTNLINVTIPQTVTNIGDRAFSGCVMLNSIYVYAVTPIDLSKSYYVFENVNKTTSTLYVPKGSKILYQASDQWKDFTNIEEMTTSLSTLKNENLKLYPSILNDVFHITGLTENADLIIIDLNGKVALNKQVRNDELVSVSSLPRGLYILKLIASEGTVERKVIKK